MKNIFSKLLAVGTLVLLSPAVASSEARSQEVQVDLKEITETFKEITFNSLPPMARDVNFGGHSRLPDLPKFSWKKGQKFIDAFPIGLFKLMGGSEFSPATAAKVLGIDPAKLLEGKLGNLKFLKNLPLKDVLGANPQLKNVLASSIPGWFGGGNQSLGQLAQGILGTKPIPLSVLNAAKIQDLPGIINTGYFKYPNIGSLPVADFFGLPYIGLDRLFAFKISNQVAGLQLVKFDKLATQEFNIGKNNRDNVSSGSNKEPYAPCEGDRAQSGSTNTCDYIELQSVLFPERRHPLNGTKSIIGQELKGGEGLLGEITTAAGLREPAGYLVPYIGKCGAKWSVADPDPRTGIVTQYLNFRICYRNLLGFQASPYFFQIPLGTASEKDNTQFLPMKIEPQSQAPTSDRISQIISSSNLPNAQKNYVRAAANQLLAQNPTADIDTILSKAVFQSFSGKSVKAISFNPVIGGSNEILKALL
jgi:hypothetical protein